MSSNYTPPKKLIYETGTGERHEMSLDKAGPVQAEIITEDVYPDYPTVNVTTTPNIPWADGNSTTEGQEALDAVILALRGLDDYQRCVILDTVSTFYQLDKE